MSKNELLSLPKKELMRMCKEADLPRYKGKTELTKEELVDSLLENVEFVEAEEVVNQDKPEIPIEATEVVEEEQVERKPWVMKDKSGYIEEAEVGALIAFYDEKGKPRTAAFFSKKGY
jgi:K+ transporter